MFFSVIIVSTALLTPQNGLLPSRRHYSLYMSVGDIDGSKLSKVAVVLLAGGKGKRMKANVPKQFLPILGKPVFLRSLDIFRNMKDVVSSIVIVLDESYRSDYDYLLKQDKRIKWADPGAERQDSVYNGLCQVSLDVLSLRSTDPILIGLSYCQKGAGR